MILNITYMGHQAESQIPDGASDEAIKGWGLEIIRTGSGTMPAFPDATIDKFSIERFPERVLLRPAVPFG